MTLVHFGELFEEDVVAKLSIVYERTLMPMLQQNHLYFPINI